MSAKTWTKHPVTNVVPELTGKEADSGLSTILWHGKIIFLSHTIDEREERNDILDPLEWVVKTHMEFRQFTEGQRDAIGAELVDWNPSTLPLEQAQQGNSIPPIIAKTTDEAAAIVMRTKTSVRKAVEVKYASKQLFQALKTGVISTNDAWKHRNTNPEYVATILEQIKNESPAAAKKKAKNFSTSVREVARHDNVENIVQKSGLAPYTERVQLYTASILHAVDEVEPDTVDVIVTDPPYPRDYLDVWEDLATFAVHALKEDGILVAMSGQAFMPEVFALLDHPELTYRWMVCYKFNGGGTADVRSRQVHNQWKPLLIYHKSTPQSDMDKVAHLPDYMADGNQNTLWSGRTLEGIGEFHHWGQRESGFDEIIRKFTKPGDLVCDPFLGSGTTMLSTLNVGEGRSFIGGDIEQQYVEITRGRFAEWIRKWR